MAEFTVTEVVYNALHQPKADVKVYQRMVIPPNVTGIYDMEVIELTSNNEGQVTFTFYPGASYDIWRSKSFPIRVNVPEGADETYNMPPILGTDVVDDCDT